MHFSFLNVVNYTKSVNQEELFEKRRPMSTFFKYGYAKEIFFSSDCPYRLADRIKLHKSTLQSGAISAEINNWTAE